MVPAAKLRCAAESDLGRVRTNNEDRVHCDPGRGIYLVVDGVGGQAAGEKAADVALSMIRTRLERQTGDAPQRIREAITVANNEIVRLARGNPQWEGMACVLTVALVEGESAFIGHVGDSRLYKIRGGRIQKITHDHSPVGEREDSGEISESDAMRHPRRNEVYRDIGGFLSGGVSADAVHHQKDAALGIAMYAVLVVGTHPPGIGFSRTSQPGAGHHYFYFSCQPSAISDQRLVWSECNGFGHARGTARSPSRANRPDILAEPARKIQWRPSFVW